MGWLLLFIAGGLEVIWLITLKMSDGFTHLWSSLIAIGAVNASFVLLGFALKTVPSSAAYATWTGIGAAGAAVAGIWLFNEPVSVLSSTVLLKSHYADWRAATAWALRQSPSDDARQPKP